MIKIHKIYEIPDCPFCHGPRTGRYISRSVNTEADKKDIEFQYLKHHEYVRVRAPQHEGYDMFCLDCGNSWAGKIKQKHISLIELDEYIKHKQFPEDTEEIEKSLLTLHQHQIKKKMPSAVKKAGNLIIKGTSGIFKNMVYQPTIGTLKDLVHITQKSQPVQIEEEITFDDLYKEYCCPEEEGGDRADY